MQEQAGAYISSSGTTQRMATVIGFTYSGVMFKAVTIITSIVVPSVIAAIVTILQML